MESVIKLRHDLLACEGQIVHGFFPKKKINRIMNNIYLKFIHPNIYIYLSNHLEMQASQKFTVYSKEKKPCQSVIFFINFLVEKKLQHSMKSYNLVRCQVIFAFLLFFLTITEKLSCFKIAHLLVQFEDVLSALIHDVRKLNDEKKKMEERYAR